MNDPRMNRCLQYVCGILDDAIDRELDIISRQIPQFVITDEEE